MNRGIQYFFSCIFMLSSIISAPLVYASQALDNAQADKAQLQNELSNLEQEIAKEEANLTSQKDTTGSISRNIASLNAQIKIAKLNISAKNLMIKKLGGEITQKSQKIQILSTKIESMKESLSQLIRKDRELDDKTILALILSEDSISDAYGDINNFSSIKRSIKTSVDQINGVKTETETEKNTLEIKKSAQVDEKVNLENANTK